MGASAIISLFLQVILLSCTLSQSNAQTANQIVDAAFASVKSIKQDFENVKLKREREYRTRLFGVINSNAGELYRALEEQLFKPEESKANAIIEGLKDTPEQICVNRLKEYITNIKDNQAKNEYSYCIAVIESDQRQVREKLAEAQENVNSFATQSEQRIDQCQRIYNIRGNVSQLQTCVAASLIRIKQISFILDNSLQSLPNSLFVNNLANCVENTITTAKKALNSNYDVIQKCFATSGAPLAEKAADIILLYKLDVSSNIKNDVSEALTKLKSNTSVTFENINKLKIIVEETLNNRNRNKETIKAFIDRNVNVVKYESALFNASLEIGRYTDSRSCVEEAQNRFKENANAKSNDIKRCQDDIKQTISLGDLTNLENQVIERQKGEAQISVALCLTNSETVSTNHTVVCSAQADAAFQTYLDSVQIKLNEISQKASAITTQISACVNLAIPSLLTTQIANKFLFEGCLLTKLSLNYTLNYE